MKKTLIHVIGNICSGKTTLLKSVKAYFPNADFYSIDEFREIYQTDSYSGDRTAYEVIKSNILKSNFSFFESSGTSKYFNDINDEFKLKGGRIIIIKVACNTEICLHRYSLRPYNNLKINDKYKIEDSIEYISKKLASIQITDVIDGNAPQEKVKEYFLNLFRQKYSKKT